MANLVKNLFFFFSSNFSFPFNLQFRQRSTSIYRRRPLPQACTSHSNNWLSQITLLQTSLHV